MKLRNIALLLVAFAAVGNMQGERAAMAQGEDDRAGHEIDIAIGENRTIAGDGVRNYSEGVKGVVEVKLTTDKTKFVVVGTKAGATTLLLIKDDGTQETWFINVYARSMESVQHEVEDLLGETSGVRVRRVGRRIFIDGGVGTEGEKVRVGQIAALYPGQVESLVSFGASPSERKIDIRIDFYFVKYDHAKTYAVGIDWPGRVGTGTLNASFDFINRTLGTAQTTISGQALPALDLAASKGWAKVLKQSTIISKNGSEATFESGGSENFPVTNGLTSTIQAIEFGTNITVLPRYDPKKRDLSLKLTASVSDLEAPVSSTVPSKTNTKLVTSVDLKLGQTLILSGVKTQSQRHSITGIPFLSTIPLIGPLFGSHRDSQEESEGAIFIVPSVLESIPQATMEMLNGAMERYDSFSGDMDSVNAFDHRPPVLVKPGAGKKAP